MNWIETRTRGYINAQSIKRLYVSSNMSDTKIYKYAVFLEDFNGETHMCWEYKSKKIADSRLEDLISCLEEHDNFGYIERGKNDHMAY